MGAGLELQGILVPTATPFASDGESLDESAIARLVESVIAAGASGLVPCGGTGEFATLTLEERRRIMEISTDTAAGRVPVVPHTGALSTRDTVRLSRWAADAGAAAVMVAPPFYDHLEPAELFTHYAAVAAAVDVPIVLYNNPAATGVDLTVAIVEQLVAIDAVRYIKDSSGDLARLTALIDRLGDRIAVINGADALALPALIGGASALIWGAANFIPEVCVRLYDLAGSRRNTNEALELWRSLRPLIAMLETHPPVATVKAGCGLVGLPVGRPRLPLLPLSAGATSQLGRLLGELGVLRDHRTLQ